MRLYRHDCVKTPFGMVKDLRIIENRDLKDILIIDNSCLSFAFNINNGVPILPFFDNDQDEELKHLTYYLNRLQDQNIVDVREQNIQAFGLLKLKDNYR
jgi:CTD small phosphatase-like protein 2